MSQPNLAPVSPNCSRTKSNNVVRISISTLRAPPLTLSEIVFLMVAHQFCNERAHDLSTARLTSVRTIARLYNSEPRRSLVGVHSCDAMLPASWANSGVIFLPVSKVSDLRARTGVAPTQLRTIRAV